MTLVVAPCFSLTILFGLLACQSLSIDGQTYNVGTLYNARGQVAGYTYPDGKQVTRSYHADGQLHEVHYDGNLIDRRTYDPLGRMDTSTYGNGGIKGVKDCLLYTSPSPRDRQKSRMPSSA